MNRGVREFTGWGLLGVGLFIVLLVGTGCAGTQESPPSNEGTDKRTIEATGPVPSYYDFTDILIPAELSLERKKSFVYSTASFTAGVLVFEGRVERESLVNFFTANMANDGWVLRSSFRYRRTILLFEKDERSCLVNVSESPLKTHVEIWVAPQATAIIP